MSIGRDHRNSPDPPADLLNLNGTWKTRDGRKIRIVDLSDDHLESIIAMTEGNYPELVDEFRRRGEEN